VPPVAHQRPPVTFLDAHLLSLSTIWAAAGTPTTVFALTPEELVRLTGGRVASIVREPVPNARVYHVNQTIVPKRR
jgi:prolyl-tRNA editing enzyme YbaK/EbsC (Cys-tRNA(Pro) deacylase)